MSKKNSEKSYWLRRPDAMFVILYNFGENFVDRRKPYRQPHLGHISSFEASGKIAAGGALEPSARMGIILFRGTRNEAVKYVESDPYILAGVVERYTISEWSLVVGDALSALIGNNDPVTLVNRALSAIGKASHHVTRSDEDLFDLGLTSVDKMRLLTKIEELSQSRINVAELGVSPTLTAEQVAGALR